MRYPHPFQKWDKEKIIDIIKTNEFIFENESGGIFQFHYTGANHTDKFDLNYLLYLRRTMLSVCNPNIKISPTIKSHKQLNNFLRELKEKIKTT